jgi:hypothetical protein
MIFAVIWGGDVVPDDFLAPVALDGSPGQAFASHKARANGIAKYFAFTRPLTLASAKADENVTVALIAHFHAGADDPGFAVPGHEASRTLAPKVLRMLNRGDGQVGTHHDYDMALKGLMVIAYRYRHLISDDDVNFILNQLVPPGFSGGHSIATEVYQVAGGAFAVPESENHLLMIESSRYLVNQLLHDRTHDSKFDNTANGLSGWLLRFMQTISQHDFLEFNARAYARLSLHALYNLHEFARDEPVRTAAQMLLDYAMVKFAVSSSRGRRVSPYRRLQPRISHQANVRNDLYAESGEQVAGFFLACTGLVDGAGKPAGFQGSLAFNGLIAGTAAYRPPPAAYILAMNDSNPAALHRFYHGNRPGLAVSFDAAEGGLEIYYSSPSFLLSAGGMFLNSGYGFDEISIPGSKVAWEQTARAQATTLIPRHADTRFADLIRFEPYPDSLADPYSAHPGSTEDDDADSIRAQAVNIGVHRGLAAGANLRPAEKKTIPEHSTSEWPTLAAHNGRMLVAWKGSGNDNVNVAKVETTNVLKIDGVEGLEEVVTLAATTDKAPALASHDGRLFVAWRGSGNKQLNLAFSEDNGLTFKGTRTLAEASDEPPALASHAGSLFLAWTGLDNEKLNVARVVLFGNTAGGFGIEGLEGKVVLGDSSGGGPALASHDGRLFLAWLGSGNDNLNLAFSLDNGASFTGKMTFGEFSSHGPSLASHPAGLFLAWKGSGNDSLNVAHVVLFGNTAGGFGIEGLDRKVVLGELSPAPPALGSQGDMLFLTWKGEDKEYLNLRISPDGGFRDAGPWIFSDLGPLGFYVAAYRAPVTRPQDPHVDNLAFVYAMEAGGMDFATFRSLTLARNGALPTTLDYGGSCEFHSPDGKNFSIWFQLTGQKYQARIVDLNDPHPVRDLSTLPLVDGEFMKAPGGHDGVVKISHPGCPAAPVVLDFSTAAKPVRTDDRSGCPGPYIDRAQALFAIAQKLDDQGRAGDARAARADAVHLYGELNKLNPDKNGPPLAPTVIQALGQMGVDFSVPQADLREWLANPDFTPYPAISQALLLLGRKLKAPVFLDVIVFDYEHTHGVASPRKLGDVRPDVLKAAVLAGSNERNGTHVKDFEQLLKP